MKKLSILTILLFCVATLFAQAPEKFSYQAVVRNDSSRLVCNRPVGVQASILDDAGGVLYRERHVEETNENGLLTVEIGSGNVLEGSFSDIPWGTESVFLRTEIDPTGGENYVLSISQRLVSVPYALYAKEAGNGFSGDYNDLANTPNLAPVATSGSYNDLTNRPNLVSVATSGDYNDLTNKPSIPTTVGELTNDAGYITLSQVPAQVNADWDATSGSAQILNKPNLAPVATTGNYNDLTNRPNLVPVATSGDYNDLTNKPTIPTVPTNVSAFVNDAGYLTGYTEIQTLADVTAQGNSAGNRQLKNVSDPTDSQDAVTKSYLDQLVSDLTGLIQNLQQQLDSLQNVVNALASGGAVVDEKSCPNTPTVTDHEGNVYATVQIGNQCWMRDNLRTTTSPSTGTYLIPAANAGYTYTGKQAFWYDNDSATYAPMNYGLLYNWNAAVDTFNTAYGETSVNTLESNAVSVSFTGHRRGICPAGWHLPSDADWNTMEATVSGSDWQTSYETIRGWRGSHAGKLASGDEWLSSTTSGTPGDYSNALRNVSGFSAVPAGNCGDSSFGDAGSYAYFWSSTEYSSTNSYRRYMYYKNVGVNRYYRRKDFGFSVRCLRD